MTVDSLAVAAAAALLIGCASQPAAPRMGGFSDAEARAAARAEPVDPCSFRTGRLVVEVEEALVREYPHYGVGGRRSEEPMLLTVLASPGGPDAPPRAAEVAVQLAPAVYHPGDRILALEGRRLVDKPLRTLRGRRLTVRLAENDRTNAPHWARLGEEATSAGGGALSAVGVPGGALTQAFELIRKIDRDDLVLLADVDLDALTAALSASGGAQRLRFQTNRRTAAGAEAGRPVAELALLVYREPEPGCR
jgi:hypothetical protein